MSVNVTFKTEIHPTENPYKVAVCIRNMIDLGYKPGKNKDVENYKIQNPIDLKTLEKLFPDADVSILSETIDIMNNALSEPDKVRDEVLKISVSGNEKLLRAFHSYIRREEMIDTAYSEISKGTSFDGKNVKIYLNKQVAYAKRVNFPADVQPLGALVIEIDADSEEKIEEITNWLTPPTKEGVPLYEKRIEDLKL